MKKITDLMDDLGFDPDGSDAVKEAFIKYLIKSSEGINVLTPTEKNLIKANPHVVKVLPVTIKPEQLAFDFVDFAEPKSRFSRKRHK